MSTEGGVPRRVPEQQNSIEEIVSTDVGEEYKELIGAELDRSHALANRKEHEVEELKWKLRKREKEFLALHPPEGSWVTGDVRKAIIGDGREPLTNRQITEVKRITDVAIDLVTLGRNAKFQEEMNKRYNVSVQEIDDNRGEDDGAGNRLSQLLR
jgi:hypothetical protein